MNERIKYECSYCKTRIGTQGQPPKGNSCPKSPNKKHDWKIKKKNY